MATNQKKRAVVSYENMSEELAAAFAEKYPKGFSDYLPDLIKYDKPDGTCFYAVSIEIPDDIERWLNEGDEGADDGGNTSSEDGGETLPDDNIAQYSSGDDDSADA